MVSRMRIMIRITRRDNHDFPELYLERYIHNIQQFNRSIVSGSLRTTEALSGEGLNHGLRLYEFDCSRGGKESLRIQEAKYRKSRL